VRHERDHRKIVSPKGEATVTTEAFAGSYCREASKFVGQVLGQHPAPKLLEAMALGARLALETKDKKSLSWAV
jgi:hypothetical protein